MGTAERPRLAVFRANKHMHAQVIDDTANDGVGHTMAHMSTLNKKLAETLKTTGDKVRAVLPFLRLIITPHWVPTSPS